MSGAAAPPPPASHVEISPPKVVIVVGWLVTASMIVATGTRLGTKLSLKRLLSVDDVLAVAATVTGTIQMALVYRGSRLFVDADSVNSLAGQAWVDFQKALYGSELLFVCTICLAKLSVLHSLYQITPIPAQRGPIIGCAALVGLILLAFQFATAFQCSTPFWKILAGNCFDQTPFWQVWGVLDITTDAFMSLFPIYIVATLQMNARFKRVVAAVFGTRITTIIAAICRLVYLTRFDGSISQSSPAFWIYLLNTEIEQGLAVITACIPFLKPFFESLETGMLAPVPGLGSRMSNSVGTGSRTPKLSKNSFLLSSVPRSAVRSNMNVECGINVSRRISTHSDECGLVKEGSTTWVEPVPPSRV